MQQHKIVSQNEWLAARKALLAKEKEFTQRARRVEPATARTALGQGREGLCVRRRRTARRRSPTCSTAAASSIVYHFMLGPDWEQGCPSCSFLADHFDGAAVHLAQRDVTLCRRFRARRWPQIEAFKQRMGWQLQMGVVLRQRLQSRLSCVVHAGRDGRRARRSTITSMTSFRAEEAPGASVFYKRRAPAASSTPIRPTGAASTS